MLVTTLPALCLFLFAVMLSPDLSVLKTTWDLPIRIFLASVWVVIPTCTIALMFSALTQESRFASFAWFAIWALGHGAWMAILVAQATRMRLEPWSTEVLESAAVKNWSLISLYNNMGSVQNWIFGFDSFSNIWPAMLILMALTIFSAIVLFRCVSAPINA
jgi:hypothetical protein